MADSVKITIEADDKTAAGIASVVANLGKIEKASTSAAGKGAGKGGVGIGGLGNALGGLNGILGAVGIPALGATAAIGGLVSVAKNAITTTMKYSSQVRDLSFITGTGAEQTSKLIQVLDDYEISAEDVGTATRTLTKQGLAPTVETLAKLSDEYNKLGDAQQKNEFIIKNLGRSGLQWVNMLNQGGDAIRELNDQIDSNLILSEQDIQRNEQYRLAIDKVKDTFDGWKIAAVTGTMDMIDADERRAEAMDFARKHTENAIAVSGTYNNAIIQNSDATEQMANEYMRLQQYGAAWEKTLKAQGVTALGTMQDYGEMLKAGLQLTKQQEAYNDTAKKIEKQFDDNAAVAELYKGKLAEIKDSYKDGEMTAYEYYDAVNKIREEYKSGAFASQEQAGAMRELEAAQDSQGQAFVSSLLAQKGASEELQYDFAAATGQISKQSAEQFKAIDRVTQAMMDKTLTAQQGAKAISMLSGDVKELNGMTSTAFVDIIITTQGDTSLLTGSVSSGKKTARQMASGGTLSPGQLAEVGEIGREGLRVNRDGSVTVIPSGAWSQMKKWGVMPDEGFAGGTLARADVDIRPYISSYRRSGTSAMSGVLSSPAVQEQPATLSQVREVMKQTNRDTPGANTVTDLSAATIRRLSKAIGGELAKVTG